MTDDDVAFPTNPDDVDGMTLLDYFAAKAMQALITETGISIGDWADDAYAMAYKMMEARGDARKKYNEE